MAVKGYKATTTLPVPVTLGLVITPGADVKALITSSLTSLVPPACLAAAAATASAATMTEAGKGGTGSDLDCLGVQVMGSQPLADLLVSPQQVHFEPDH